LLQDWVQRVGIGCAIAVPGARCSTMEHIVRALILLLAPAVVLAGDDSDGLHIDKVGKCIVDGSEAAEDLMDAGVFIWAATKRCADADKVGLKCEIDVVSAVMSVNSMINIILRAVAKCGQLDTVNPKCGLATSDLLVNLEGIAAASGAVTQYCSHTPPPAPPPPPQLPPSPSVTPAPQGSPCATVGPPRISAQKSPTLRRLNWEDGHEPAMCAVDVKNSMKSIFKAIMAFSTVKKDCEEGERRCAKNALKIVAALAGMGEYLAGTVGHCSHQAGVTECGQAAAMLVKHLTLVGHTGIDMQEECGGGGGSRRRKDDSRRRRRRRRKDSRRRRKSSEEESDSRRRSSTTGTTTYGPYPNPFQASRLDELDESEDVGTEEKSESDIDMSTNLILAAFLPVSAVLGFVGGGFYARRRLPEQRQVDLVEAIE